MNKLILIGGDLASGKSSLSKLVSDKFFLPRINKDIVKEIECNTFSYTNREENLKLSHCSFDIIEYFCTIEMSVGADFIVECNFKKEEIDRVALLVEKYHYEVLSLILQGDIPTLHKRFLERLGHNRHIAHMSQDFSKLEDYYAVTMNMRKVDYLGIIYQIDTTNIQEIFNIKHFEFIRNFLKK